MAPKSHVDDGGSGPSGCPHLPKDMLHYDEVQRFMKQIQACSLGATDLALIPVNAHPEITKALSDAITFKYTSATVFHSMAWFFQKPSVGLDGIAAHWKLAAQVATLDACKAADLVVKTGGCVHLGAIPAPPHSWHIEGESDPLHAFEVALAMSKVEYEMASKLFALAVKANNAHLADFAGNTARATSERVRSGTQYVSHLKAVCGERGQPPPPGKALAVKAFDRILPLETQDLQYAVAAETIAPNHLLLGAKERELVTQSLAIGRDWGTHESRRALLLSKMNA